MRAPATRTPVHHRSPNPRRRPVRRRRAARLSSATPRRNTPGGAGSGRTAAQHIEFRDGNRGATLRDHDRRRPDAERPRPRPRGSVIRGVVSDVDKAGRIDRDGSLTLTFDRLIVNGRDRDIRGSATQVFESKGIREEGTVAGAGAGVGGIVGGIIGGVRGAILGAVIGAGGAIAATDGKDITLPAGSIVRVRMDSPVRVS